MSLCCMRKGYTRVIPDYFSGNNVAYYFDRHLSEFKDRPVDFLQIGVFAGAASVWMLENVLTHPDATLTDVDTWLGSPEHEDLDFFVIENHYDKIVQGRTIKIKNTSDIFFATNTRKFDFVYIDGDHSLEQVLKDGQNGISVLKPDGIITFDDTFHQPIKEAVDTLQSRYCDNLKLIEETTHQQMWFKIC